MRKRFWERIKGKELLIFSIGTMLLLLAGAFAMASFKELLEGMRTIILSRDALITDYFELAGVGAAFLNAALVMGMGILLIWWQKIPFTGLTMAVLFINAGFALFGKKSGQCAADDIRYLALCKAASLKDEPIYLYSAVWFLSGPDGDRDGLSASLSPLD